MSPSIPRIDVLIVEDVDPMRLLLQEVLAGAEDIRVSGSVQNGWDARLELTRRRPHLVLLDEILPGESSGDLLAELVSQGISVILVTETGGDPASRPLPPGVHRRLGKPGWDSLEADRARFHREIRSALLPRSR
jgi:DNA-binding NtrC family response regulator